jgi:hypothetical protein
MGDADNNCGQDQRCHQQLDQIEENIRKQLERLGEIFKPDMISRQRNVDNITNDNAHGHPEQYPHGKPPVHRSPLSIICNPWVVTQRYAASKRCEG